MKISISSNLNQFILPKFFFLHLLIYFVYEGGGTCGSQKTTDGTPSPENIYIGITRINNRFTARERNQDKWHIDTLKFSSQLPLSHTKVESIQRCIYRCMYFNSDSSAVVKFYFEIVVIWILKREELSYLAFLFKIQLEFYYLWWKGIMRSRS